MADATSHQPYQFGDVVDGYRWTITGWEPVTAPARTVGVPRLLEARYAATQQAQAREQSRVAAPEVGADDPGGPTVDLEAVLNRRVVAAPDLVVEFHEPEVTVVDEPWTTQTEEAEDLDGPAAGGSPSSDQAAAPIDDVEPGSSAAESQRSWYGLGWDPVEEEAAPTADDSDAPFAAALALGTRALAEQHHPSDIEIAAGLATAAGRGEDRWNPLGWDQVDEWTGTATAEFPPSEAPLDAHALAYSATFDAVAEEASVPVPTELAEPEPEPVPEPVPEAASEPRAVTVTPEPAAGWYPGSS